MLFIHAERRSRIAPLFSGMRDTLIQTCLQGHMGEAWADDLNAPTCAMLVVANFCYVAGNCAATHARDLLCQLPPNGCDVVVEHDGWKELLLALYPNAVTITRYAIKHEGDIFDRQQLRAAIQGLSSEYTIKRFDEALYYEAMQSDWSHDFCAHFKSAQDYLARGRGYAILHNNRLVCGASSYTIYDGGLEIEVDTHIDFRRRGLALVCAAALILDCLEHGIYPSWDAANLASVKLCQRLGYHLDREYKAYCLTDDSGTPKSDTAESETC